MDLIYLVMTLGCNAGGDILVATFLYFAMVFVQSPLVNSEQEFILQKIIGLLALFILSTLIVVFIRWSIAHKERPNKYQGHSRRSDLVDHMGEGIILMSAKCDAIDFCNHEASMFLKKGKISASKQLRDH